MVESVRISQEVNSRHKESVYSVITWTRSGVVGRCKKRATHNLLKRMTLQAPTVHA